MNQQKTEDWHYDRLGRLTGSRAKDLMGTDNARLRYMADLASQICTGNYQEIKSPILQHGIDNEPKARREYELITGCQVTEVGFIESAKESRIGCSVDGLVDESGLIEIKCPVDLSKHVLAFKTGYNEKEHKPQIQWNLMITDRRWCDFVSYVPTMPPASQIYIERVWRDPAYIELLSAAADAFLEELDTLIAYLTGDK